MTAAERESRLCVCGRIPARPQPPEQILEFERRCSPSSRESLQEQTADPVPGRWETRGWVVAGCRPLLMFENNSLK